MPLAFCFSNKECFRICFFKLAVRYCFVIPLMLSAVLAGDIPQRQSLSDASLVLQVMAAFSLWD